MQFTITIKADSGQSRRYNAESVQEALLKAAKDDWSIVETNDSFLGERRSVINPPIISPTPRLSKWKKEIDQERCVLAFLEE